MLFRSSVRLCRRSRAKPSVNNLLSVTLLRCSKVCYSQQTSTLNTVIVNQKPSDQQISPLPTQSSQAETETSKAEPSPKSEPSPKADSTHQADGTLNAEGIKPKRKRFWPYALAVTPLIYYWWTRRTVRNEARENAAKLVSCDISEVKDLMKRTRFSYAELEDIYNHMHSRNPSGRIGIEQFGSVIARSTNYFKENRSPPQPHPDEDPEDFEPETDLEKLERKMEEWDAFCLYRNSNWDEKKELDINELMAGLSILVDDIDHPIVKVSLAWKAAQPDDKGRLNEDQLAHLLDTMIRAGHIDSDSLAYQTKFFPPEYKIYNGKDIANLLIHELGSVETHGDSYGDTDAPHVKMTLPQFQEKVTRLSSRKWYNRIWDWRFRSVEFWYVTRDQLSRIKEREKKRLKYRKKLEKKRLEEEEENQ